MIIFIIIIIIIIIVFKPNPSFFCLHTGLIRIAPFINTITASKTVVVGQDAEFMCTVYHHKNDKPDLKWYVQKTSGNGSKRLIDSTSYGKMFFPVNPKDVLRRQEFKVRLRNVSRGDEGWYTCYAGNKIGWKSESTYLKVI